jgi:hypothetical protein
MQEAARTGSFSKLSYLLARIIIFHSYGQKKNIAFGSFARRTKRRPLDDVDQMIALKAEGGYYHEYGGKIEIFVPESAYRLQLLCFENTNSLNSRKVVNQFVTSLKQVPQYERAETKRNQEAATLNLKSYPWTFDIVPCFFTTQDCFGKDYYLIPDGNGYWKKTDPRIDRDRVTEINQHHNGNILNTIRLVKYWNSRPTMPSLSSYLIENMILDYYSDNLMISTNHIGMEIVRALKHIHRAVNYPVSDPKEIQGDLNNTSLEDRRKVSERAFSDLQKAIEAVEFEIEEKHELAIKKWEEILGKSFPDFG